MSDIGDAFRELRQQGQEKRARNRERSAQILQDNGVVFSSHNGGAHLVVRRGRRCYDFWPGTGRWRTNGARGFGVESLLKQVASDHPAEVPHEPAAS